MDGLIIKKRWLDKIFDNGKMWEIRSGRTKKRGKIALIQSKTDLIIGTTNIIDCWPLYNYPPYHPDNYNFHQVPIDELRALDYKLNWAWVLRSSTRFKKPIKYKKKPGAVIWIKNVL